MRPARKGPENLERAADGGKAGGGTSMRPARKGPENLATLKVTQGPAAGLQ